MDYFLNTTIDTIYFQIENVEDDNACLYRALANALFYRTKKGSNKFVNCEDKNCDRSYKDVYQNEEWGYSGNKQEDIARQIQKQAREWLDDNQNTIIENFQITYKDLVESEHDMEFDEYLNLYQYFAGDVYTYEIDTKYKHKIGPKKGEYIKKEITLDNRWGGTPELIAISHICKLPILIYTSQTFNKKLNKPITGRISKNKAEKNVRFKLYQINGSEYLEMGRPPLLLLWKNTTKGPHYMCLYLKDNIKINENGIPV